MLGFAQKVGHQYKMQGFLFSSESLPEHWARLDEFEGEGYERVLTKVQLKNGTTVHAYIYRLSGNGSQRSPSSGS